MTETILIRDDEATLSVLHNLRDLGVRIAMDDFGTGFSSLSYLHRFPFDKIKIDRCFIKDLPDDKGSVATIKAVIGIAKAREIAAKITAELGGRGVFGVELFVKGDAIDPVYYESRYYVAPDRGAVTAFQLLRNAMLESDRMAIAWVTLRQRRHLAAIRPYGEEVMLLTTMVHADEVLPAEFWMPESGAPPSEKELKMARMLIDALAGPFEAERFTDEHRERVLKAIEQKKPIESPAAAPSPTRVLDLMAALEASVKAAKAARAKDQKEQARPERKRKRG